MILILREPGCIFSDDVYWFSSRWKSMRLTFQSSSKFPFSVSKNVNKIIFCSRKIISFYIFIRQNLARGQSEPVWELLFSDGRFRIKTRNYDLTFLNKKRARQRKNKRSTEKTIFYVFRVWSVDWNPSCAGSRVGNCRRVKKLALQSDKSTARKTDSPWRTR